MHGPLTERALQRGLKLHGQSSIVDLFKLLDLDSGLHGRQILAYMLDVAVGPHGSAAQNIARHHAIMEKLADNRGEVPKNIYALLMVR